MKSRSRIKIFLYLHFDGQTGVYILQGCGAGAGAAQKSGGAATLIFYILPHPLDGEKCPPRVGKKKFYSNKLIYHSQVYIRLQVYKY